MVCLAARRDKLWIVDGDERGLVPMKLVRVPVQQPAKGGKLHVLLLERSV